MSEPTTPSPVGPTCPFAILGIAPTLDLAQVKRAWFAALPKHPPHQDPDGFRRLRAAYETLTRPGGLPTAFAASPLDLPAELTRWQARFAAPLAQAAAQARLEAAATTAVTRFVEDTSRLTLGEALVVFATPGRED